MTEIKNQIKISLGLWKNKLLVLALLFLIEQSCVFFPESNYCQLIGPYICDPEPISAGDPDEVLISDPGTVFTPITTTTSGIVSGGTATTV